MTPFEVEFLLDEGETRHIIPKGESDLHSFVCCFDGDDIVYECECKPVAKNILPDDYAVIHNPLI